MTNKGVLWIGSLEPYMDERFIWNAFNMMGHQVSGITIKNNRRFCIQANYGFVQFKDDFTALMAMHELNKTQIPGSNPPVNFLLKPAMFQGENNRKRNFSLWISKLSPDVNDLTLYKGFSCCFPSSSVRKAKVILYNNGFSKGYGFVEFDNKEDQELALNSMDGFIGIGSGAIRVRSVIDHNQNARNSPIVQMATNAQTTYTAQTTTTAEEECNHYFAQNWSSCCRTHPFPDNSCNAARQSAGRWPKNEYFF